jgi:hypothetical protein
MDQITAPDVLDLLNDYVDRFGADHRTMCTYIDYRTLQPRCPVGFIFRDVGMDAERIKGFGSQRPRALARARHIPEFTEDAVRLLQAAQLAYDEHDAHDLNVQIGNFGAAHKAASAEYNAILSELDIPTPVTSQVKV